ncbi:MAG: hypothetical protein HYY96_17280 [Candidatus Tectomicrobia bacterium]|nr:hypothetical protein [Candidatus Tectomicrobia bacterium]
MVPRVESGFINIRNATKPLGREFPERVRVPGYEQINLAKYGLAPGGGNGQAAAKKGDYSSAVIPSMPSG